MPISGGVAKKLCYIYTMEFYAAERRKELLPFATAWMNLENIMLSEISQSVKKNTTGSHLYVESYEHNKLMDKTVTEA